MDEKIESSPSPKPKKRLNNSRTYWKSKRKRSNHAISGDFGNDVEEEFVLDTLFAEEEKLLKLETSDINKINETKYFPLSAIYWEDDDVNDGKLGIVPPDIFAEEKLLEKVNHGKFKNVYNFKKFLTNGFETVTQFRRKFNLNSLNNNVVGCAKFILPIKKPTTKDKSFIEKVAMPGSATQFGISESQFAISCNEVKAKLKENYIIKICESPKLQIPIKIKPISILDDFSVFEDQFRDKALRTYSVVKRKINLSPKNDLQISENLLNLDTLFLSEDAPNAEQNDILLDDWLENENYDMYQEEIYIFNETENKRFTPLLDKTFSGIDNEILLDSFSKNDFKKLSTVVGSNQYSSLGTNFLKDNLNDADIFNSELCKDIKTQNFIRSKSNNSITNTNTVKTNKTEYLKCQIPLKSKFNSIQSAIKPHEILKEYSPQLPLKLQGNQVENQICQGFKFASKKPVIISENAIKKAEKLIAKVLTEDISNLAEENKINNPILKEEKFTRTSDIKSKQIYNDAYAKEFLKGIDFDSFTDDFYSNIEISRNSPNKNQFSNDKSNSSATKSNTPPKDLLLETNNFLNGISAKITIVENSYNTNLSKPINNSEKSLIVEKFINKSNMEKSQFENYLYTNIVLKSNLQNSEETNLENSEKENEIKNLIEAVNSTVNTEKEIQQPKRIRIKCNYLPNQIYSRRESTTRISNTKNTSLELLHVPNKNNNKTISRSQIPVLKPKTISLSQIPDSKTLGVRRNIYSLPFPRNKFKPPKKLITLSLEEHFCTPLQNLQNSEKTLSYLETQNFKTVSVETSTAKISSPQLTSTREVAHSSDNLIKNSFNNSSVKDEIKKPNWNEQESSD